MWYKKGNLEILHVGLNIKLALYQHKHFHPSGDTTPSKEDINVSLRLKESGKILGIDLLDHIIIGAEGSFCSIKQRGII
jgi:DNA repair protein RadC